MSMQSVPQHVQLDPQQEVNIPPSQQEANIPHYPQQEANIPPSQQYVNILPRPQYEGNIGLCRHVGGYFFSPSAALGGPAFQALQEPLIYVNPKQHYRIMKRREARAKLAASIQKVKSKKTYIHESRHNHALRRPRGAGGRFMTAEEMAALRAQEAEDEGAEQMTVEDSTLAHRTSRPVHE